MVAEAGVPTKEKVDLVDPTVADLAANFLNCAACSASFFDIILLATFLCNALT